MRRRSVIIVALGMIGVMGLLAVGRALLIPARPLLPEGVLRVGVDASYPPFAVDPGDGALAGLDIDLARAVAEEMGVALRFVNMGYDGLYDSLRASQVDALFSALCIDPLRTQDVRYTTAYVNAGQVLVHAGGGPDTPAGLEGGTVAVEFGTEGDLAARRWQRRLHRLTIVPFATAAEALGATAAGEADAAFVDAVSARLWRRDNPASGLVIAPEPITSDLYAAAVRQDNPRLQAAINAALRQLRDNGTLEQITNRWLGEE